MYAKVAKVVEKVKNTMHVYYKILGHYAKDVGRHNFYKIIFVLIIGRAFLHAETRCILTTKRLHIVAFTCMYATLLLTVAKVTCVTYFGSKV